MSECLIVRLSSQKTAPIRWAVWSLSQNSAVETGEFASWDDLSEIQQHAEQRPITLLLDTADVILSEVEIPPGAARQLEGLVPYLLEDDLAQDVDELHFSVLSKKGQQAYVCGVSRVWLSEILAEFASLGLEVKRVLPDVLALPIPESGLSAVENQGQWLIRKGEYLGVSVESAWLESVKGSDWVKVENEFLALDSYSSLPELSEKEGQLWQVKQQQPALELLAGQAAQSSFNLLTGAFKPRSALLKHWKVWQKTAIAAAVLIVIMTGYNLLKVNQYENQASAYRAESERIFREVFPNRRRIPTISYLKRLMEEEVQHLSGTTNDASLLVWLNKLPETVGSVPGMQLQSIKYDSGRGELRIEATSKDFQSFEKARIALQKQFKVQEGQLGRDGEVVSGTFLLTQKGG